MKIPAITSLKNRVVDFKAWENMKVCESEASVFFMVQECEQKPVVKCNKQALMTGSDTLTTTFCQH